MTNQTNTDLVTALLDRIEELPTAVTPPATRLTVTGSGDTAERLRRHRTGRGVDRCGRSGGGESGETRTG